MTVRTSAGTTLRIAVAAPATFDAAGYGLLFPTTPTAANPIIGEITELGEFGREYTLVTHSPIGTRVIQKQKGAINAGTMSLQLALSEADLGQIMLKAASQSDAAHSFALTAQGGRRVFFRAMVMSFTSNLGGVDSIASGSVTLEITANAAGVDFVEVAV